MPSYLADMAIVTLVLVLIILVIRFVFRLSLDLFDITRFLWTVRKNDNAYRLYKEEKAKALEKKYERAIEKAREQGLVGIEEEVDLEEIYHSNDERFKWRKGVLHKMMGGMVNLATLKAMLTGKGPMWQIKIRANQERDGRGEGRNM